MTKQRISRRHLVTLSEYARHRGITRQAVQKEVGGRLQQSVVTVGRRPFVTSIEAADREWEANASRPALDDAGLASAHREVAIQRARYLRLASDVRQGKLVDANMVAKVGFEFSRILRENVLNVPPRIAPELAAETDPHTVFDRLDAELRLALEATAKAMVS